MKEDRDLRAKLNTVYSYHDRSKHHFRRYAASLGYLDWATQPDPFRRFEGCAVEGLDLPKPDPGDIPAGLWDRLFRPDEGPPGGPLPVDSSSLSRFFYHSMALSAWKEAVDASGEVVSRWALRVNPSSGNLHPTEAYLVGPDGLFHYRPDVHGLEKRAEVAEWPDSQPNSVPNGAFLVGLTSIHWREAWKYGERAFRYCQHDVGHALAAIALAARCQGWSVRLLPGPSTAEIEGLLGVAGQSGPEKEHGDAVMLVTPGPDAVDWAGPLPRVGQMVGEPNVLSPTHKIWPFIDEVAAASVWPGGKSNKSAGPEILPVNDRGLSAFELIRGRRSAVSMDGQTGMKANAFFDLLGRLLPAEGHPVFDVWPWAPEVSLALFVHRVEGLEPGLYCLVRDAGHLISLQENTQPKFAWEKPAGCPENLPLYLLGTGDVQKAAAQLSCGQDIAGDGAFSLGMLARFDHALETHGPGFYPRLFWETGMIGQMLYLESEAAGLRGTGIGCFFDDEVHGALGIKDHTWQSLYHFTVGGPVEDGRLQTEDAYPATS
jgi:SagB-type dehydrogenase family enzyme